MPLRKRIHTTVSDALSTPVTKKAVQARRIIAAEAARIMQLLLTSAEDEDVELTLFNDMDLRQAPPSPIDGRPQKRASISELV